MPGEKSTGCPSVPSTRPRHPSRCVYEGRAHVAFDLAAPGLAREPSRYRSSTTPSALTRAILSWSLFKESFDVAGIRCSRLARVLPENNDSCRGAIHIPEGKVNCISAPLVLVRTVTVLTSNVSAVLFTNSMNSSAVDERRHRRLRRALGITQELVNHGSPGSAFALHTIQAAYHSQERQHRPHRCRAIVAPSTHRPRRAERMRQANYRSPARGPAQSTDYRRLLP